MTDLPDWSSSVNIQAGSVTITAGSLVLNFPAGTSIDPRSIRALTASDVVAANQGAAAGFGAPWPAGVSFGSAQVDPRSIRGLTTADQVAAGNLPAGLLNTQQPQSQPSGSPATMLHSSGINATFTVPLGTHAISFLFVPNAGIVTGHISNLQVKGITSGAMYKVIFEWDLFSTSQGQLLVVPIDSAVDTQINLNAGWTDTTIDVKVYVAAILDTTAVYVGNSLYDPISVEYSSPNGPNGTANPVYISGHFSDYATSAVNAPAAGTKATAAIAANSSAANRCGAYHMDADNGGTVLISGQGAHLINGVSGGAAKLASHYFGFPASNASGQGFHLNRSELHYSGNVNTAMTVEFNAALTSVAESVGIGAL